MIEGPLFVDSVGWVALFNRRDSDHERAAAYWRGVKQRSRMLLTTDYVLDETYTLIRRSRAGPPGEIEFHRLVTGSRLVEIAEIDARRRERAWELFTRSRLGSLRPGDRAAEGVRGRPTATSGAEAPRVLLGCSGSVASSGAASPNGLWRQQGR